MTPDVPSIKMDDQASEPLMQVVIQDGRRNGRQPTLAECRRRTAYDLERLTEPLQRLKPGLAIPYKRRTRWHDFPRGSVKHCRNRQQPSRLRGVLRALRKSANLGGRIV